MTTPSDPTMSHDSLDAVIAAYMLAVEGGEVPNRQELIERHTEHAGASCSSSPTWIGWIGLPRRSRSLTTLTLPISRRKRARRFADDSLFR